MSKSPAFRRAEPDLRRQSLIEACARVFALRIWSPLLATSPEAMPIQEPNLDDTWQTIAGTPAQILDVVKQRRQDEGVEMGVDVPLEVLALRLGGYALDACGEDKFGPRAGQAAHDTCLWLRKLQGLADESRLMPASLETALSAIFWRLVDTARGTTLGVGDDVAWLGPFAAWWALVIDRPKMLERLATALPMMDRQALTHCCDQAEILRTVLSAGDEEGRWGADALAALQALQAQETELAHALAALSQSLARFGTASGRNAELETMCEELVLAGDRVQAVLADSGIAPPALQLEVTESLAAQDDAVRGQLQALKALGLTLALDDFGTGYSSLAYLKRLPVHELKIDKSFVMAMESDEGDAKIVRSTIDLAHNLGLSVVAEGVENEAVLGLLHELQCDEGQGYHMSKPLPAAAFCDWVARWQSRAPARPGLAAELRDYFAGQALVGIVHKELAATMALRMPIADDNWSLKVGGGWPEDSDEDIAAGVWAGVVPLTTVYGDPERSPDCDAAIPVPPSVRAMRGPLVNRRPG